MNLEKFVEESIMQIANGIKNAQASSEDILICPSVIPSENGLLIKEDGARFREAPQMINFDIAVTVTESKDKKGSGEVQVLGLSFGGGLDSNYQNSSISRIKFEIPIVWQKSNMKPLLRRSPVPPHV